MLQKFGQNQKCVNNASLSCKYEVGNITEISSSQFIDYYVKIVGLSPEVIWNVFEIIEQKNDSFNSSSFFIKTTSSHGTIVVATALYKEGAHYLLINDPADPTKTCTCTSDQYYSLSECTVRTIDPCESTRCSETCEKTSTWTDGRSLLKFFGENSRSNL